MKIIASISLVVMCFLAGCGEDPQEPPKERYSINELAEEPPISQKDMDILLEITPLSLTVDMTDFNAVNAFVSAHGLTYRRYCFLKAKMPLAMGLVVGVKPAYPDFIPQQMRVSPEEESIVRNNFDKLQAAGKNLVENQSP
ncbi:MAG: hypothetical protein LBS31_12210 [Candidatus Adiutrix sp.]|nr:hypothetical protein [Candidatus Adiutrix sp.]